VGSSSTKHAARWEVGERADRIAHLCCIVSCMANVVGQGFRAACELWPPKNARHPSSLDNAMETKAERQSLPAYTVGSMCKLRQLRS